MYVAEERSCVRLSPAFLDFCLNFSVKSLGFECELSKILVPTVWRGS